MDFLGIHWSIGGKQLFSFAPVVFLGVYFFLFVNFLFNTIYYYYHILIIKLVLPQPMSFLTFTLLILFPFQLELFYESAILLCRL